MVNFDESSSSVNEMWLKWRENRGVMGFLPPPGGPMAPTNIMSTSLRKAPLGVHKAIQFVETHATVYDKVAT